MAGMEKINNTKAEYNPRITVCSVINKYSCKHPGNIIYSLIEKFKLSTCLSYK